MGNQIFGKVKVLSTNPVFKDSIFHPTANKKEWNKKQATRKRNI